MPNRRELKLQKYGITPKRYKELCGFCEQYPEWKEELKFNTNTLESKQIASTQKSKYVENIAERSGNLTREELEEYPYLCNRIKQLDKRIANENNREIEIVQGKVKGSMREHPYIETHMSVEMYEPKENDKSIKRMLICTHERDKLIKRKEAIEDYIDSIDDLQIKTIFEYVFIDEESFAKAGKLVGYSKGRISQIIANFFKD